MKTVLYDTNENKKVGSIRHGRYLVDGQPGPLPAHIVELEVVENRGPIDPSGQIYHRSESVDLQFNHYVISYTAIDIPVYMPSEVPARSLRLSMIQNNVTLQSVQDMIDAIVDPVEKETITAYWEHSVNFHKDHPLLLQWATQLGLTQQQMDQIFIDAGQIE